jgi:hypothetical protein
MPPPKTTSRGVDSPFIQIFKTQGVRDGRRFDQRIPFAAKFGPEPFIVSMKRRKTLAS